MKKNIILFLFALIIIFLIAAIFVSQRQIEQNKKAQKIAPIPSPKVLEAGQKKLDVYFASQKTTLKANELVNVSVMMKNTSQTESMKVNVGEVDVNFDKQIFTASFAGNNPCNPSFLYNAQIKTISHGDVYIVCSLGGGDPLVVLSPGQTIKLADFNLTLNPGATMGSTRLSFAKTNIPNAGDAVNLTNLSDHGVIMELRVE